MPSPTAEEQYLLELLNEARLDPLASTARYISSYTPLTSGDVDIQFALKYFGVSGSALESAFSALTPVGPLAWNDALGAAAENHSAAMIAARTQSHQVPGEPAFGDRLRAEGYQFNAAGENVYAYAINPLHAHAGFMVDWGPGPGGMQSPAGHRDNIMNPWFREAGIDITKENRADTTIGPFVVTQDLAARSGKYFILGVAYTDSDGDGFYSIGEGRADLNVSAAGLSVTTGAAGGYSLETGKGAQSVVLSGGGLSGNVTVATSVVDENVKLDVVNGNILLSSASVSVTGEIGELRALGARGLSLATGDGTQILVGNSGDDILDGGAGWDIARYDGQSALYRVTANADGSLKVSGNGAGTDTLINIETIRFADGDFHWDAATGSLARGTGETTVPATNNTAPVTAASQDVMMSANAAKTINVTATDADGDTLAYSYSNPAHGTITVGSEPGKFVYIPTANFLGTDSFVVTVSDGKGGTAQQTVNIQVNDPTAIIDPPVAAPSQAIVVDEDKSKNFTVVATDPDGNLLTYTASAPANGTVTGGGKHNGNFTYTPKADFNGTDSFVVTVSDGTGGVVRQTVTVTVNPVNDAPVTAAVQEVAADAGAAKQITVSASDVDGDTLSFYASDPANGTVAGGTGGIFTYTPKAGFNGTDSFIVTVNDGQGGLATQNVKVTVTGGSGGGENGGGDNGGGDNGGGNEHPNPGIPFRMFARDGFEGGIGGTGTVYGTNGTQEISLLNAAGTLEFDSSFARGGDVLRFAGKASAYRIAFDGEIATLSATGRAYEIPVGVNGLNLSFDDGVRTLIYNTAAGAAQIGNQTIGATAATIIAPAGSAPLSGDTGAGLANLFLGAGGSAEVGGAFFIGGTAGKEFVAYHYGDVELDGSFARGGDTLDLPKGATSFEAYVDGSMLVLVSSLGTVKVPVGLVGMTIDFDGDERVLRYDETAGQVMLGDQAITATSGADAVIVGISSGTSLDIGSPSGPATLRLDPSGSHTLTDNANRDGFVQVLNFNSDDSIIVTNAKSSDYNFTLGDADRDGKGDDLIITYNHGGITNYIALIDVAPNGGFVHGEALAEKVLGWDFISFA